MATPYNSTQPDAPTGSSAINGILGLPDAMAQIADWIGGLVPSGATVYDTQNVPVEMASGYTTPYLMVRRIGRTVFLRGQFNRTAGGLPATADSEPCFTIPDGFRPNYIRRIRTTNLLQSPGRISGIVTIPYTGECNFGIDSGSSTATTGDTIYIEAVWDV